MIFFKATIFIFFFLVSNNIFATGINLPDCSTLAKPTVDNLAITDPTEAVSRPGDTCNYYIDGTGVPPCSTLSSNNKPRLNCMDLENLPSCDILKANHDLWVFAGSDPTTEPKTQQSLRNCLNLDLTSPDHDICISGDGKTNGINCVNFCHKDNSDNPPGCKKRMYHHYTDSDINVRLGFRNNNDLQYSCEKLTSDELMFFSDEFTFKDCRDLLEIFPPTLDDQGVKTQDSRKGIIKIKVLEGVLEGDIPIHKMEEYMIIQDPDTKQSFVDGFTDYAYDDEANIAALSCKYPLCDFNFQNLDEATNEGIQNSQDVTDSNGNLFQLKNCTNVENEAFITPSKIVCSGNKMCYDFTVNQISKLISSPNRVEKCLNNARDDRSVSRCFSYVEQEKMCQIHRTLGPDCKQSCNNPSENESCFFSNCALLPTGLRNVNNCSDTKCPNLGSGLLVPNVNCYDGEKTINPGTNCNFYDIINSANYDFDYSALDDTYELNSLDVDTSDAYKDKFFKKQNVISTPTSTPTFIPYSNLAYANIATNKNTTVGRKFPDYLRQDICDTDLDDCDLDFAADCNYPSDTFKPVCISSKDPFFQPDLDLDNINLDKKNVKIKHNVDNDIDNDWFYKPYPLVDKGRTNADNRQFRNVDKWINFINWGDGYNGSLFNFTSGEDFVVPRDNAEVKYKNTNDNEMGRGVLSNRLCYDYGHLKDLDIINSGELAAQTATIVAAGLSIAIAIRLACWLCPPGFEVAASLAAMYEMKDAFNFNKFISPKQCHAVIIRAGFSQNLDSSNVSGHNGEDADDNEKSEYAFQYDEIDVDDKLIKRYKFLDDSSYHNTASAKYNYFKQEFLLGSNFNADIKVDVGSKNEDLSKIVLTKDSYVRGDIYTTITGHNRQHHINACVRFGGGARSCSVECNLIHCYTQACGNDVCKTLIVNDDTNLDSTCSIARYGDEGLVKKSDIEFSGKDCVKEISGKGLGGMSGKVRVRAVTYPGRYVCIFADAKHSGEDEWRVRGLIPSVSKSFKTLEGFGGGKIFTEKYCLRYSNRIDATSTPNMIDCSVENPPYSCSPIVRYASNTKKWTDSFMIKATTPITVDNHKSAKKILFSNFKRDIFVRNTDVALNKVFKADFFNPSILVDFGSELAMSSLQTGCLGGANGVGDYISSDCDSSFDFISMPLNNDDDNNCRNYSVSNNDNCPRRNVKISDDGIFKLKSNRYNDFTGKNYKKFLYIKKTISGDTPTITLLDDQNNPIEGKPILRNLPDYTNIILNYDDSEGEFTIKLKDNTGAHLSPVKLKILNASNIDLSPSLEWITASEDKDSGRCFDRLANKDNLENMNFCLKQDECSPLFTTCIENNLINADRDQKNDLWRKCFDNDDYSLINKCSKKWNIDRPINKNIIEDMIIKVKESRHNNVSMADNKYYGWHHEVCLSSKSYNPVKVYSYGVDNNVGKCILDPVQSGNAVINNQGTDNIEDDEVVINGTFVANPSCNSGGNEALKNTDGSTHNPCFCLKSSDSLVIKKLAAIGFTISDIDNFPILRDATPRELGLCFDKDLPLSCQSNIRSEINKYGDDGRYKKRTMLNEDTKYAEYDFVFLPFSQFDSGVVAQGQCNENWGVASNGRIPSMVCKKDSSVARFDDHKIEIIFNDSCVDGVGPDYENCVEPDNIKLSNNDPFDILLTNLTQNKKFKDSDGARLGSIPELFASGDSIILKSVDNEDISAIIDDAGDNHIKVKGFDPAITPDFILSSIEYNRSENTSCSRPKCHVRSQQDQFYRTSSTSDKGGRYRNPIYQERSLLDKKAHEVGYAEWRFSGGNPVSIIAEDDIDIYVPASGCLDGFAKGSDFPQKTCTPEGVVSYVKSGNDVVNACERKSCVLSGINWDNPDIVDAYGGANFNNLDLDTNALKASRSTSNQSFDFGVTDPNERSTVTGECYYDLTKGFTYLQDGNNPPQLACNHDGTIVDMYSAKCVPANCAEIITPDRRVTNYPNYSAGGYVETLGGIYAKSQKSCSFFTDGSQGYKNYPYDLESKYQDSIIGSIISSDAEDYLEITTDSIIKGGSTPIRNCYNSNSKIDSYGTSINAISWNEVDNPCVIQCLGAQDIRTVFAGGKNRNQLEDEEGFEFDNNDNMSLKNGYVVEDNNEDNSIFIVIDKNLKNYPPKTIEYNDGKVITVSENQSNISIRYPNLIDDTDTSNSYRNSTVIEIRKSINDQFTQEDQKYILTNRPIKIDLVTQINTGITKHRVSTRTDEIEIEWPSSDFNRIQYAYFNVNQSPFNVSNSKHYKIYSNRCYGRFDCSEDITFSDNPPSDYFERGRVDGKFLVARKCSTDGVWSEVENSINQNNLASYQDPNNAYMRVTPLCAFKGDIPNTNLRVGGNNLMYNGYIASSQYYLTQKDSVDNISRDLTTQDTNSSQVFLNNINYKNAISAKSGYSLANTQSYNLPFSIQKCQYDTNNIGKIDKLSLYEYNSNNNNFDGLNNPPIANKYCDLSQIESKIDQTSLSDSSTAMRLNKRLIFDNDFVTYNKCDENYTFTGNDLKAYCNNGNIVVPTDDVCLDPCTGISINHYSQEYSLGYETFTGKLDIAGSLKDSEYFEFAHIFQFAGINRVMRSKYTCSDGTLTPENSNYSGAESGNACDPHSAVGGSDLESGLDNDSYRFFNYKRPNTISYSNILLNCKHDNCRWMGFEDSNNENNIDCERGLNGYRSSMP